MGRLTGKTVLLTGGGSGIGKGIAALFADEGARLLLTGTTAFKLRETIAALPGEHEAIAADISSEQDVRRLAERAGEMFGELDVLINNAGTVKRNEDVTETTQVEWERFMSVNLLGVFLMCKYMIPMMKRRGGSIVNIASQLATVAAPGYASYSMAKGGTLAFTRSLAVDYGAFGIRANCISPGLVETPMAYVGRGNFDELKPQAAEALPLRRIGRPEDIAYAALYLASDEASWVTGANLAVDGGYTAK